MGRVNIASRSVFDVQEDGYELLADIKVDSNRTFQDFVGLSVQKGDLLILRSTLITSDPSGMSTYIYINDVYENSNYQYQYLAAVSSTPSAQDGDSPFIVSVSSGKINQSTSMLTITNDGHLIVENENTRNVGAVDINTPNTYISSDFFVEGINEIRILANKTDGIGIGSRFQLYKLAGGNE